jgi:C-terminal peptidase prc
MRSLLNAGVLAAISFAALVAPAPAAEEKSNPKTYIVLVGVGSFDDKQIKPRPTAEADAAAFYDLFTSKEHLGVDGPQIRLLTSNRDAKRNGEPATKANILKAMKWAATNAKADDLVVIGLFGQGAPVGDRTCYFGADATHKDRSKNAVSAAEIEAEFKEVKTQKLCVMIDVNLKGFVPAPNEAVIEPNILDMVRVFVGNEDKEEHALPAGRVVYLASNAVVDHIDKEKNGLFTEVMIAALKGAADKEGYEPDGLVTIDELTAYLEAEMPKQARALGTSREQKEQAPVAWGTRLSHFELTKNPAITPKTTQRLAKIEALAKDGKLTKDVADEASRLLSRMPKLKAQQEMRKNYQKLADGGIDVDACLATRTRISKEMKLDREDAEAFATKVLAGVKVLRESYVRDLNQGELVAWAVRGLFRRVEEKVPTDLRKQLDNAKNLKRPQLHELLADVRERLGKREDLAANKDVDLSLQMMMSHLDPYTTYIDKDMLRQLQSQLTGEFTGIGVQIRRDMVRDGLLVVTPIKGGPAYRAGIKAGDLITEITREVDSEGNVIDPPEVISTKGMRVDDAVKKILGQPRTKVKIKVEREGSDKPLVFELQRSQVQVETVVGFSRKPDDSWDYTIDKENKIAYIRLTQFGPSSARDMEQAVRKLEKEGIKGLVFDMRFNPGGLLTAAVRISDLFIDDGLIVTIKPRPGTGEEQSYGGEHEGSVLGFPIACLVNGGSASGSEIVAACLQDHKRAVVIGERSYGKGSVQNVTDFASTGAKIKLTTASFWRPNGKNLNKASTKGSEDEDWGVRPDPGYSISLSVKERGDLYEHLHNQEVIPRRDAPSKDAKSEFKDRQLESALDYLKNQIKTAAKAAPKKAG